MSPGPEDRSGAADYPPMAPSSAVPALPRQDAGPAVIRRPVLDRTLRTVGYELIPQGATPAPHAWPAELLSSPHPLYVRVTPEQLCDDVPLPFDPEAVVLELPAGGEA